MKQIHLTVYGKVQGVGFRYFSQMKAVQYDVRGWVKNSEEGAVEILAEGTQGNLDLFIEDVRRGNPFSKVNDVIVQDTNKTDSYQSFKIKY
ncbi:acylphosphatase [Bacillus sp. 1NLA3E]|uniref:acylphosphatase n=1 Tax=Bacillus sp. 1NLA3E TaxID=666686 RepID=UPI000247E5DC|nr:acylphosphatase [Bacillus sp. 1NLA3E]AGK52236.1 acylphosphatase [Bacillus sp. 1NLA3E]